MEAKDKAENLVLKFLRVENNTPEWFNTHIAKQCAIIAVQEIIAQIEPSVYMDVIDNFQMSYWQEVKQEINNL
jgi:hypothetical protein